MSKGIDVSFVVDFLNDLFEKDPKAIEELINLRVSCNDDILNHESVQVSVLINEDTGEIDSQKVGILGVLNGLLGVRDSGYGKIAAEYDETGKMHRFLAVSEEHE